MVRLRAGPFASELPLAAVQFHPESIMTLGDDLGLRLIGNVVARLHSAVPIGATITAAIRSLYEPVRLRASFFR